MKSSEIIFHIKDVHITEFYQIVFSKAFRQQPMTSMVALIEKNASVFEFDGSG